MKEQIGGFYLFTKIKRRKYVSNRSTKIERSNKKLKFKNYQKKKGKKEKKWK